MTGAGHRGARAARLALRRSMTDEGATMVEYAVMLALVAAVCIVVVSALGIHVGNLFGDPAFAALP